MTKILCFLVLTLFFNSFSYGMVIYGSETQLDYFEIQSPYWRYVGNAVPAIFDRRELVQDPGTEFFRPIRIETVQAHLNICSNQRYSRQPSLGHCSGVQISPTEVLTASHCVLPWIRTCEDIRFVFGYFNYHQGPVAVFPAHDVFSCRRIIWPSQGRCNLIHGACERDMVLIEMDRPHFASTVSMSGRSYPRGSPIVSLSYPLGTPLKYDFDGRVLWWNNTSSKLSAAVDVGPGSSGGPVFDLESGDLVGLTVSESGGILGVNPFEYDQRNHCFRYQRCPMDGCESPPRTGLNEVSVEKINPSIIERLRQGRL